MTAPFANPDDALGRFRPYLMLLARLGRGQLPAGRISPSDVVQQTLMEAHRDWAGFRGQTEAELAGWLRQALARNLANAGRDARRAKRDYRRERSVEAAVDDSALRLGDWLAANQSSPSARAHRAERALRVASALAELPELQREAVIRRHFDGQSLATIAGELETTTPAVAGLLHRGLKRLRALLADLEAPAP